MNLPPSSAPAAADELPLRTALHRLAHAQPISRAEAEAAFRVLMRGGGTPVQTGALLLGIRARGETADEVAGAADALRSEMVPVTTARRDQLVDTCGTGGGRVGTINISTAAAFVAAGAGVPVAKHGNRSYTSRSGSADVLEALGIDIGLDAGRAGLLLDGGAMAFLFAPNFHPAMRYVAPARRELAVPTIMNLLGPLVNPAGVRRQVVGVADAGRGPLLAEALLRLGAARAVVVHAEVGMDEISPSGRTFVWEVRDGTVQAGSLDPASLGLAFDSLDGLAGGDPAENAARIEEVLAGSGRAVERCAVLLNAAAALYVSAEGGSWQDATRRATESLASGAAAAALARLRREAPRRVSIS